jgi:hypothetical protein
VRSPAVTDRAKPPAEEAAGRTSIDSPATIVAPAHADVLALQRGAGNQAVSRHLSRLRPRGRVLARYVDQPAAQDLLDVLPTLSVVELRAVLRSLDSPPLTGDRVPVTFGNQSRSVALADAVQLRSATAEQLRMALMRDLADGRRPLFAAMTAATTDADRRARTVALRAFDGPFLSEIRGVAVNPATRYQHPDAAVQDGALAAVQLDAVANAEGYLASPADAHQRSRESAGMGANFDWCGFFAMENYMLSDLDSDLKRGFFHVTNVEHYFTYRYAFGRRDDTRVMKWIYAEDDWHDLREYHTSRGSLRTWINAAAIFGGGTLDIRAGDIVLIDHSGSGAADHIVMVQSWDPTTHTLFPIGGNDGGYEVDTRPTHEAPPGELPTDREKRERLEAATGQPLRPGSAGGHVGVGSHDLGSQPNPAALDADRARGRQRVRIYGIGRPSIVDFEEHRYDSTDERRPPAAAPR